MRILFSTIVLDGNPFLPMIYSELRKLPKDIDWTWSIMEGTALPMHCTKWCAKQEPRLSQDGTTQYLWNLAKFDPRVQHISQPGWAGKVVMVNAPLVRLAYQATDEVLLWQMDSDEVFTSQQIADCYYMFRRQPEKNAAYFWCRYFVGPDKVITTRNCFGNNSSYEWLRVWRIKPGMLFKTHEPPVIDGLKLNPFTHEETEARGLVFDHMAYCTRAQVEFKEAYYAGPNNPHAAAYKGLTERWEKFQQETEWPRSLHEMFPWAEENCLVDRV